MVITHGIPEYNKSGSWREKKEFYGQQERKLSSYYVLFSKGQLRSLDFWPDKKSSKTSIQPTKRAFFIVF